MRHARTVAVRAALLLCLWLVLSGGSLGAPLLVILIVGAATATSLATLPRLARVSPVGLARFAAFFVRQSLAGGVDVARRSFARGRADVDPAFVEHEIAIEAEAPRLLLAACSGLLPGTLTAAIDGRRLVVHVLDPEMPWRETLIELEARIAGVFGLDERPGSSPR
jgi:multicomponent Na+:H+ antiporter subunit E